MKATTTGDEMRLEAETFQLNSTASNGTIASFMFSAVERFSFSVTTGGEAMWEGTGAVGIRFGTSTPTTFRLYSESEPIPFLEVDYGNNWFWNQPGGGARMTFQPDVAAGAEFDAVLTLGNDAIRGHHKVMNDGSGANPRPGVIELLTQDDVSCYLFAWYDSTSSSYQLRVRRNNDPADTGGGTLIVNGIVTT